MKKKKIINVVLKKIKIWGIIAAAVILITLLLGLGTEKSQTMDKLTYNVQLDENGNMHVTEVWDIYINQTNTIFKNFERSNKYGEIKNVKVKDLETGKFLKKIDKEMYHVTTGCYYALYTKSEKFEIAWGTGMEYKRGKKKYEISYTVTNVVNKYKDCEEMYWQFLSDENSMPVRNIVGTIKMPKKVIEKNNLKAWGHGPLNGKIEVVSNDTIKFSVKNLNRNKMLEIRTVNTEEMFDVDNSKIKKYRKLDSIIEEETIWADEANGKTGKFYLVIGIVYLVIIAINIIKAIKFYKFSKRKDDGIIHTNLKYFREIPREESSTPPEAAYMYFFNKDMIDMREQQSNIIAATILNLALKKYISLDVKEEKVYVEIVKDSEGLNDDEKAVYNILKGTAKQENGKFQIEKINSYAKKNYTKYSEFVNKVINEARENIYKLKLVDKAEKRLYQKAKNASDLYNLLKWAIQFILIVFIVGLLPICRRTYMNSLGVGYKENFVTIFAILLPFIITLALKWKFSSKTQTKIAVLTQEGAEEQEKWKGLANYIRDFSMINERDIPSLAIWEKYLVFATAFGLADKAIEQMKAKYPEVFVEEYWKDEILQEHQIIRFASYNMIYNINGVSPIHTISTSTSRAYSTSLTEIARHSSSSGSGGGGGFSGGGRRPAEVEAGMGRKINNTNKIQDSF